MSNISRMALFSKLNALAFKTVEGATVLCKLRGNSHVELVHWVAQILQQDDSDWHHILRHFKLDLNALLVDVQNSLEKRKGGANSISDLHESLTNSVERAWVYGSLMYGAQQVRTAHVLLALLKTDFLSLELFRISTLFKQVDADILAERLPEVIADSPEELAQAGSNALPGQASGAIPAAQMGAEEALKRYTQDLTERARAGEIDPVTGREAEVRQIVDILLRRRQNNPLITGEAGVGKTAVVEGFALRVAAGEVPPALAGVRILSLDLGLLQAGASMKGEFEQRLRQVIDEVQASEQATILFIDEVHTLVGAGGAQGTGDAANLLKPALARGTLRTIGATTWAEYKKYIEKDPALTRRFQVIQVDEPSEVLAVAMLRGVAPAMQGHHGVIVLDDAVKAAVQLSHRYIPARQLPDKAISLLDTACARVAVSQHACPPVLEDVTQQLARTQHAMTALQAEQSAGWDRTEPLLKLNEEIAELKARQVQLQLQWEEERQCLADWAEWPAEERAGQREAFEARLAHIQGDQPMVHPQVDATTVAGVVADWTGIPVGRMVKNEIESVLNLSSTLAQRIIGQDHALELIARRIQTNRAGLDDPNKPVGVFMLAGTSGVGKTETALALAENLFGGEHNLITINMSEYQEAHTVSSLKGAPPGYVGYGEGGVLTEAVRRKPYSVVLLDEVEKAHPDVHELFFQVFDKGWMEDGEGRRIDFRNTLILLTTNVGTDTLMRLCARGAHRPSVETLLPVLRPDLLAVFPPALLGRLDVVPYYPLSPEMLSSIIDLQLERIRKRLLAQRGITLQVCSSVLEQMVARCNESDSGGRVVGALLSNSVLPAISRRLLELTLAGQPVAQIKLSATQGGFGYEFINPQGDVIDHE